VYTLPDPTSSALSRFSLADTSPPFGLPAMVDPGSRRGLAQLDDARAPNALIAPIKPGADRGD
jgi:hypothetical protein